MVARGIKSQVSLRWKSSDRPNNCVDSPPTGRFKLGPVSDNNELFTIGQLAKRTGVKVRTIRFWSDAGIIAPTARSNAGYRLYDSAAVARLDLIQTLRALGMGLASVKQLLRQQVEIADVAQAHVRALDIEIRTLRTRRAILHVVAQRKSSTQEARIVHKMAQLSAAERQDLINEFVDKTFEGVDEQAPGAGIANGMRMMPAELPDDPTPQQVDAWIELAELVADEDFQLRCRQMAVAGANADSDQIAYDPEWTVHAQQACDDKIDPGSEAGQQVLNSMIDPNISNMDLWQLADQLAVFTDRRVERYWTLLGMINGWPAVPARVPAMEWLIDALRAHAA